MKISKKIVSGAAALALSVGPTAARAEPPGTTLDELSRILIPAETIAVTDVEGRVVKGRLTDVSSRTLAILTSGGQKQVFDAPAITAVRRMDSLTNGTWIGAGLGAASTAAVIAAYDYQKSVYAKVFGNLWLMLGAGAVTGALVDRAITRTFVLPGTGSAMQVSPILGDRTIGLSLSRRLGT